MNAGEVTVLDEPLLIFGNGQKLVDPRDGLSLFGPWDAGHPSQPMSLSYGIVGTVEGIQAFSAWAKLLHGPVLNDAVAGEDIEPTDVLWPPFPGFEAATGAILPEKAAWGREVDRNKLDELSRHPDAHLRAAGVVGAYYEALRIGNARDDEIRVLFCIVPEFVWKRCRPNSVISKADAMGSKAPRSVLYDRKKGQADLFDIATDLDAYQFSVDFRRQLKAKAMEFRAPIQLIRESTLRLTNEREFGERDLSPVSDRAWNMAATAYYKAGGKPWKLATARAGVCYLGLAFKRAEQDGSNACCAAQMFLDSGDGIVFLGEFGPWYSRDTKQFHLTRQAAMNLLAGALQTYREQEGGPLTEIFIHAGSEVSAEEFKGFQDACPPGVKLVAVRIRHDGRGVRLFRNGTRPVLRGTFLKLSETAGLLWTNGFKERIRTYDGWEVPVPQRVSILHGKADIEQVARDILSLTKLNYNACKLGDSMPVTVHFSDAVGEILVNNPQTQKPKPNFKYYI